MLDLFVFIDPYIRVRPGWTCPLKDFFPGPTRFPDLEIGIGHPGNFNWRYFKGFVEFVQLHINQFVPTVYALQEVMVQSLPCPIRPFLLRK